ncbi:MAG TPA: PLDc N-terminal domain-containing protein [Sinomonas sp.]|nr:PLDc N-terminal domain-containing protein [Sinomonas sp.]
MDGAEAVFLIILFIVWNGILAKVTMDILAADNDRAFNAAWILIIWTMPLVGLIVWAFKGRSNRRL